MPAVWKVTNPTLKRENVFCLDKSQHKLSQTWVILDLKVNWIDKNTDQCFALLLVDKNSVKKSDCSKNSDRKYFEPANVF